MLSLKNLKFSIRFSILSIFTVLFLTVGTTLIFFNYYAKHALFMRFAENTVETVNQLTKQQITNFLTPVKERLLFASKTIDNKIITPKDDFLFTKFLLQILNDQPDFAGAYWSNPDGVFLHVERIGKNLFNQEISYCEDNKCFMLNRELDSSGNILNITPKHETKYDPRQRPWYIKTFNNKTITLSDLYMFFERPMLGVTMSIPLYDAKQSLYGMLSIDIHLKELSNFVTTLKLTENSNIFLFTADNTLVASKELQNYQEQDLPKVHTSIKTPWILQGMKIYSQTKNKLLTYSFHNHKYLAHYDTLENVSDKLYIAIMLPIADITGPLTKATVNSATITIIILFFGIILICLISNNISKPIRNLTHNAQYIRKLNLEKINYAKTSRIKEINYLQNAFIDIKQSLNSFVRYVPFSLVQNLMLNKSLAQVGGENKRATFLFSDIQGFTSISENMDPQTLAQYLSEYFNVMTQTIIKNKGTLDKYIGDAIMAFWGAPSEDEQHAYNACNCAIEMLTNLNLLNNKFQQQGQPTINIRIGIHTGDAMIGNIGSNERLNYTAIGDNVNLASRLESLNKNYHTSIIVSNSTYKVTKNNFDYRFLDKVSVRGKRIGGHIYELIHSQHKFHELRYDIETYNSEFRIAFEFYQNGMWDQAITAFTKLLEVYHEDFLISIYIERCNAFKNNPPQNWEGTWHQN